MEYSPEQLDKLFSAVNDITQSLKQFTPLERHDFAADIAEIKTTINHMASKLDSVATDHEERLRCIEKSQTLAPCPHHDGLKEWQTKVNDRLDNGETRFDNLEIIVNNHITANTIKDKEKEKVEDHTREYTIAFIAGLIAFISAYILAKIT